MVKEYSLPQFFENGTSKNKEAYEDWGSFVEMVSISKDKYANKWINSLTKSEQFCSPFWWRFCLLLELDSIFPSSARYSRWKNKCWRCQWITWKWPTLCEGYDEISFNMEEIRLFYNMITRPKFKEENWSGGNMS